MNKWILICILALVAAYIFMPELFPSKKYKADPILVKRIDSLEKVNATLQQQMGYYDSLNESFQTQIFELDYALSNAKGKTTIIREVYKEKKEQAQKFTPTQVDSFFKDRYKY